MAAAIAHMYASKFIQFSTVVDTINECPIGTQTLRPEDQQFLLSALPLQTLIRLADRNPQASLITAHELLKRLFATFFSRVQHMATLWDVLDSSQAIIAGECLLPAMLKPTGPNVAVSVRTIDIITPYDEEGYEDILAYLRDKENASLTDSKPPLIDFDTGEIEQVVVYTSEHTRYRVIRSATASPIGPFLSYKYTHLMQFVTSSGWYMPYHALTLAMKTVRQTAVGVSGSADTTPFTLADAADIVQDAEECGKHPACGATWRSLSDTHTFQLPWRERESMRTFERFRWRIGGMPCCATCNSVLNGRFIR